MIQTFTIYSLLFLVTALVSFFGAFLAWQRRKIKGALEVALVLIFSGLGAFFVIFETAASSMIEKIFWARLEFIGGVFTPVFYLIFVLRFMGKDNYLSGRHLISWFIIPFITLCLVFTNGSHYLIWSGYSAVSAKTNLMEYYHGPGFWIGYVAYSYLLLILATLGIFSFILRHKKTFRSQGWIILIGGLLPWTVSIFYLTGVNIVQGLDIAPISISMSGILMIYAVFNTRFLDLIPIARETLVETLPDGILALDHKNRIQDINEAALSFLGIPTKDVLGLDAGSTGASVVPLLRAVMKEDPENLVEVGEKDQVKVFQIIQQSVKNNPGSRLIVIRDMTLQKKSESDIHKRDILLDAIVKATDLLVQNEEIDSSILKILEILGKATAVNRVYIFRNHQDVQFKHLLMSQILEWSGGMPEPRPDNPKLQNISYNNFASRWFEILSAGGIILGKVRDFPESERIILEKQGIQSLLVVPIMVDNAFWGFIGFDDCTHEREWLPFEEQILAATANTIGAAYLRKYNRDELIKAKEKAEESDTLKSAFLANMSHEIRTPMSGILGFTELLKEPKLTGEEQQEYIRIIEKSGARMLNIINDIFSISRLETGLVKAYFSEVNINEQLEFILHFFKLQAEEKGITLVVNNSLTPLQSVISSDKEKLCAVLTHLTKNAIKFTSSGSIELSCRFTSGELEFCVKDTGIGIPPEQRKVIFERFRQASEIITRDYDGAGLGLSIAKAYLELLRGRIWVDSEPGKGSSFYFTLPA